MNSLSRRSVIKDAQNYSDDIAPGASVILKTIDVPSRCRLWITDFGNGVNDNNAWTYIYWQFLENGIPIPKFDAMYDQRGFTAGRQPIGPIEVQPGSVFKVKAVNGYTSTVRMGVSLAWEIESIE